MFGARVRVYVVRQNNVHSHIPCGKEEKANEHYPCEFCVVLCVFSFPCRHLGHVTWTIYTNFESPFPRKPHIKFGTPGSSFEQTMMGWSPRCYIPSFLEIGPRFRRRFLKGFYHIWAWRTSWSCDQHHVYKFSFPCT